MRVVQFNDVEAFYARVEPYLLAHEAEHNLVFGLLSNAREVPPRFPDPILLLVEQAGDIQLVALQSDAEHNFVLSLAQTPEAVKFLATDLFERGMSLRGVHGLIDESRGFAETWSRLSGQTYFVNAPLRTYKLEQVISVTGVPGTLRRARPDDRDLLVEWEMGFRRDAFPDDEHHVEDAERTIDYRLASTTGGMFVWDDNGAVSYAGFGGPTPHGIRVGPVYTPPELRAHGYASACVAGMSQFLLDSGRQFCFLFTDLRNPTSNHIYQVIGYQPVCDFTDYGFSG